jgi:hypothetical protein
MLESEETDDPKDVRILYREGSLHCIGFKLIADG